MASGKLPYPHAIASLAATTAANSPALARIRVVLVRPSLPANIGAAARAMMTMGLTRLVLVAPRLLPDAEATAVASGPAGVLSAARVAATLDEALAGTRLSIGFSARARRFAGRAATVRDAAREAVAAAEGADGAGAADGTDAANGANPANVADPANVALVFGTEMSGLTNDELMRCTLAASIPANPEYPSLNLAAAVQVAAWEIRAAADEALVRHRPRAAPDAAASQPSRDLPPARHRRFETASHGEVEALYAHAQRTLVALGFLDLQRPRRLLVRLRRLFGRAQLEREEVNVLRGILARVDERCGGDSRAPR